MRANIFLCNDGLWRYDLGVGKSDSSAVSATTYESSDAAVKAAKKLTDDVHIIESAH
jgi:hypothetical protein